MKKTRYGFVIQILAFALLTCGHASARELHDFTSDGCSLFPDGNLQNRTLWCDCCFAHDIAYWRGGTKEERKRADELLRECVLERTNSKALADLMYEGVRAGGHPAFPTWYRWGYGWRYGRGYAPLTEQEQQHVREKLDAYHAKHPAGYCGPKQGVAK
jgi:hypothetical protein